MWNVYGPCRRSAGARHARRLARAALPWIWRLLGLGARRVFLGGVLDRLGRGIELDGMAGQRACERMRHGRVRLPFGPLRALGRQARVGRRARRADGGGHGRACLGVGAFRCVGVFVVCLFRRGHGRPVAVMGRGVPRHFPDLCKAANHPGVYDHGRVLLPSHQHASSCSGGRGHHVLARCLRGAAPPDAAHGARRCGRRGVWACRSGIGRVFLRCPRRAAGASEERGPLRGARAFRRLHGGVLLGAWVHARPHVGAAVRFGWRDRRGDVRRRCDSDGCGGRCERGFAWRGQDRPGLQACGSPHGRRTAASSVFGRRTGNPCCRGHHVGLHPVRDVRVGFARRPGFERERPHGAGVRVGQVGHERGPCRGHVRGVLFRIELVHAARGRFGIYRVSVHRHGKRRVAGNRRGVVSFPGRPERPRRPSRPGR